MVGWTVSSPPSAPAVAEVARRWTAAVGAAGFLPAGRARTRAALEGLLHELLTALRAPDPDSALLTPGADSALPTPAGSAALPTPDQGHAIGVRLVELRMGSPAAIGATVTLLAEWLPQLAPDASARIPGLLGRITAGAGSAQRTAAVRAAESLNSAEKAHWRRVFAGQQEHLRHQQLHDPYSSLPNRAHLHAHLAERISTAGETGRLGLCLLSIGDFGQLTDAHGDALDDLLAGIGTRLDRLARDHGHFVAHLGDDLFAAVTTTVSSDDLVKTADQARRAINDTLGIPLRVVDGLLEGPAAGTDPHRWIRDARRALGWARQDGGERAVFDPARAAADLRRRRLVADLPGALDNQEIVLHYQPIVDLEDDRVIGVEALARWRHDGRLRGPDEFIPLAEQSGLIHRLGAVVLEQACRQASAWRRAGRPLLLSVNVSPYQLAGPDLSATVAAVLQTTGLPADQLQLEITESAAAERHEHVLRALARLGVKITLDDFGTGYANLAALTHLPITGAKLDRRFIQAAAAGNDTSLALIRHLLGLFQRLGLAVVAEGIETSAQRFLLSGLGYRHGQGFLLGRPQPAGTLTDQLLDRPPSR
jgi:diguanylate cyclase